MHRTRTEKDKRASCIARGIGGGFTGKILARRLVGFDPTFPSVDGQPVRPFPIRPAVSGWMDELQHLDCAQGREKVMKVGRMERLVNLATGLGL